LQDSKPFPSIKLGEMVLQFAADQVTLQDLHCSDKERNKNTAGHARESAPVTSTMARRKSLCVLPDLSKEAEKRVRFRAPTPLTKKQVEKVNNSFDSLESKSQNLVKWLTDQQ